MMELPKKKERVQSIKEIAAALVQGQWCSCHWETLIFWPSTHLSTSFWGFSWQLIAPMAIDTGKGSGQSGGFQVFVKLNPITMPDSSREKYLWWTEGRTLIQDFLHDQWRWGESVCRYLSSHSQHTYEFSHYSGRSKAWGTLSGK